MTGSALLDCYVLKGFGIYMIGILDSLSDVVEALCGHSSCNLDMKSLLDNIKGIGSPFFLFRPLTKLPHPHTAASPWLQAAANKDDVNKDLKRNVVLS